MFAIKADGHCCYHLSGVIGSLCKNPELSPATCSANDLAEARAKIRENFAKVVEPKREFFPEPQEWEAHIATIIGEPLSEFTQRLSGQARGKAVHGTITDLALYTLQEDVRVIVIATDGIFSTTPDEELFSSVVPAFVPGECEKSRVVCAILHKEHFDLGVLRTTDSVQAVFQMGPEWDRALRSLLSFLKARSPLPGAKREDLGPRWAPPTSPRPSPVPDEKEVSENGGQGGPRTRAGSARVSKRVGERRTGQRFICAGNHTTHHTSITHT